MFLNANDFPPVLQQVKYSTTEKNTVSLHLLDRLRLDFYRHSGVSNW